MASETPTAPPAGILTFLGGLLLLAIFAFGILYWVREAPSSDDLTPRRAEARKAARAKLDEQHAALLTTDGWVDKAKGVVHVPIQEAMTLTVAELKSKKVTASTVKLDIPLPPVVIDPKSTEPPPVALPSAPQGATTVRFDIPEATGQPAAAPGAPAAAVAPPIVTPTPAAQPPTPTVTTVPVPPPAPAAPAPAPAVPAAPAPAAPAPETIPSTPPPPPALPAPPAAVPTAPTPAPPAAPTAPEATTPPPTAAPAPAVPVSATPAPEPAPAPTPAAPASPAAPAPATPPAPAPAAASPAPANPN